MSARRRNKLIPFRADQPPAEVLERFADAHAEIEALWRSNREFREICRDYREARASLQRGGEGDPDTRASRDEQFAELVAELEEEMTSLLRSHVDELVHSRVRGQRAE